MIKHLNIFYKKVKTLGARVFRLKREKTLTSETIAHKGRFVDGILSIRHGRALKNS